MIVKKNKQDILSYLEDTSNFKGNASLLYIPRNTEEVNAVLEECVENNMPLTVSAAGTGTTAGRVPIEGAVLSVEKLNKVLDIDLENSTVKAECGVSLQDLEKELNKHHLTLRAQPTEPLAFLGGVVSTCASGPRSFKYDSIRRYVRSLKVSLSNGRQIFIERGEHFAKKRKFDFTLNSSEGDIKFEINLPSYTSPKIKSSAGYFVEENMDFIDLFIGQEGTLGVITEVELFVQPLVYDVFACIVFFPTEDSALDFVDYIKSLRGKDYLYPCSLEFFDKNSLDLLKEDYSSMPSSSAAVYFEQEAEGEHSVDNLINYWCKVIEQKGASLDRCWFAESKSSINKLYEFRHRLPQKINEILRANNQVKMATDIAVPDENFHQMYSLYKKISRESGIFSVNFGHIGQNHLHFNFLPKNNEESFRAKGYIMELIEKAVSLKGTISAEHGIGKVKKPYLEIMYGKKHLKEMAALKKSLDPHCILGLDNIFSKELLLGL